MSKITKYITCMLFSVFLPFAQSASCVPKQNCINYNGEISCNSGANCTIGCNILKDCTNIICHDNSICDVYCTVASACQATIFNATDAAKLTITTKSNSAAYNSIVYCPNTQAHGIRCILQSEDKDSASQYSGVTIYAIEGFYAVSITCYATDCASPGGITLYCGQHEDEKCPIDISSPGQFTKCQSPGSPSAAYCEHPPTYQPITLKPTTSAPTFSPTFSPLLSPTLAPTVFPTLSPTLSPSLSPNLAPTISPTFSPSSSPTLPPTDIPTLSPTFSPAV
eukprot:288149_1